MQKSRFNILNYIPEDGAEFVLNKAEEIKRYARGVEDRLKLVSKLFLRRRFGCAEAIVQGEFPRLPKRVFHGQQRFCEEEAVKDFLLLSALGIPRLYASCENFKNLGLGHALVLVPSKSHFIMPYYGDLMNVKMEGDRLYDLDTRTCVASGLDIKPDEQVLALLRQNKRKVLGRATSPQLLDRVRTNRGNIEARMFYSPDELRIEYIVTDVTTNSPFYYDQRLKKSGNTFLALEECGLALNRAGFSCNKIPLFTSPPLKSLTKQATQSIKDSETRNLTLGVMYNIMLESCGDDFLSTASERWELVADLESKSKSQDKATADEARATLDYNTLLRRVNGPVASATYLDSLIVRMETFRRDGLNLGQAFRRISALPFPAGLFSEFCRINIKSLKDNYFNNYLNAELKLTEEFTSSNPRKLPKLMLDLVLICYSS
ncbi:MAG: hypothetical protein AABW80_02860 [Nanoarchaeota archaeon]